MTTAAAAATMKNNEGNNSNEGDEDHDDNPQRNRWRNEHPYRPDFGAKDVDAKADSAAETAAGGTERQPRTYRASCYCGRVTYLARGEPLDSKLCHCRGCQLLHGAPFEWVSIFDKSDVRFDDRSSLDYLYFYSSELDRGWDSDHAADRVLPCKVSCSHCRAPVADEGRNMWLAFATLFQFESVNRIPPAFRHACHLFYGQRCINIRDDRAKWVGHKNRSPKWDDDGPKGSS